MKDDLDFKFYKKPVFMFYMAFTGAVFFGLLNIMADKYGVKGVFYGASVFYLGLGMVGFKKIIHLGKRYAFSGLIASITIAVLFILIAEKELGIIEMLPFCIFAALTASYVSYGQYKFKTKGMDIFRIAAHMAGRTDNGFTTRPMTTGRIDASIEEIKEFAEILHNRKVALWKEGEDYEMLFISFTNQIHKNYVKDDYSHISWVRIAHNGDITVNIIQYEYNCFKGKVTFRKLCESVSDIFRTLFEFYKNGEEDKIEKYLDDFNL